MSRTERQHQLKPSSRQRYEGILQRHVLPAFGPSKVGAVDYDAVSDWIAKLQARGLLASSVRHAHQVLSLILRDAVRAKRISANPAEGVSLPKLGKTPKRFLTAADVARLADAAPRDRLVFLTLAYTGLRFGELAALRVRRLDLMRRRLEVVESVTEVGGVAVFGSPKTHQTRSVPIPRFLIDELTAHVAGKGPDAFVFPAPGGGVLRLMNWRRRVFDKAADAAGLAGLTPHELRHTAASLAIASGANVKDVQRMLGHASASMTLDVYAGLFEGSSQSRV